MTTKRRCGSPGIILLAILLTCGSGRAMGQGGAALPIPEPPRQRELWTPPVTKIPPALVAAAAKLFDLGLADPRGGEYRTIEVSEGLPGGGWPMGARRRGWVFPTRDEAANRLAVGWDGLLYPVARVGEPADLEADFAVSAVDPATRSRRPAANAPVDLSRPDAIQVCLLLRLGQVELAERIWAKLITPSDVGGLVAAVTVYAYDQLVHDFSWSVYARATTAFERGDDPLALHDVRFLTRLAQDYDRDATARGVARPQLAGDPRTLPSLEYLDRLPELLADLERRAREPARPPAPAVGRGDRATRVATLIRDLDRVGPDPSGREASFNPFRNKTVLALAAEGDTAVVPLIETLRRDDRLMRVIRDGQHRRDPVEVGEAAFYALTMVLKSSDFGGGPVFIDSALRRPEERRALADRVQAYWDRRKDLAVAERWYLSLADDAGEQEWLASARQIVEVEAERPWTGGLPAAGRSAPPARFRGEALRSGHEPTVSDLLVRRTTRLIAAGNANSTAWMADCALAWDPAAALPTLQAAARLFRTQIDRPGPGRPSDRSLLILRLSRYVVPRVRQGDRAAAAEYAALIRQAEPRGFDSTLAEVLEPLRHLPDEPALAEAADWMFNDPASPWAKFGAIEPPGATTNRATEDLLTSSLLLAPGFRRAVLARLDDKTAYGTAQAAATRAWTIQTRSGSQYSEARLVGDPSEPAGAAKVAFRLSDFVAWRLSTLQGCPRFALSWSEADRDAAIVEIRAFFERFGPRFVADDPIPRPRRRHVEPKLPPFPAFPPLDRPATAADVAEGRALFTLDQPNGPPAERRVIPLPDRPLIALWEPPRVIRKRGEPAPPVIVFSERMGRVWQAEEVLEDGRWRRYFGVALPHKLAQIPAEEIDLNCAFEIPGESDWHRGPAYLNPPDAPALLSDRPTEPAPFALGAPVIVPIRLRNTTGLDVEVPTEPFRREGGRVVAVDRRLWVALRFAPPLPRDQYGRLGFDDQAEQPVRGRSGLVRFDPAGPPQTLGPAGSLATVEVNLLDLFPLDRPGRYTLQVGYPGPETRLPGGSVMQRPGADSQSIAFVVGPPADAP